MPYKEPNSDAAKAGRKATVQKYRAANQETLRAASLEYYYRDHEKHKLEAAARGREKRSQPDYVPRADTRTYSDRVASDPAWRSKRALSTLLWRYKLTPEAYEALMNAQQGKCAICGEAPTGKKWAGKLHVDHDHTTKGKNRGLLCGQCNRALERIEKDPDWGNKAVNYLAKYVERQVAERS